jgi:hypothetical protein
MNPQEQEDDKLRSDMQKLGRFVDSQLPYGWGFVVLAFPYGEGGRMNYISNAKREDVMRSMYEFIEATRAKWGEQVPDPEDAAQDEPLGRARQELAEIKRLCARAADALEQPRDPPGWATLVKELRDVAQ